MHLLRISLYAINIQISPPIQKSSSPKIPSKQYPKQNRSDLKREINIRYFSNLRLIIRLRRLNDSRRKSYNLHSTNEERRIRNTLVSIFPFNNLRPNEKLIQKRINPIFKSLIIHLRLNLFQNKIAIKSNNLTIQRRKTNEKHTCFTLSSQQRKEEN